MNSRVSWSMFVYNANISNNVCVSVGKSQQQLPEPIGHTGIVSSEKKIKLQINAIEQDLLSIYADL